MKLFLYSLLFCYTLTNLAQNEDYFERLTTDDGLSQSDINVIHQDRDGFMWFGTHDGLNRYDGYSFKVFSPDNNKPNSISNNLIFNIEEDFNGNFWIGTTGGGLIFFDKLTEKFKTYKYDKNDPKSINSDYVAEIYADRENRLWIGTSKGINLINLEKNVDSIKFQSFNAHVEPFMPQINISSVNSIYQDSRGQIWTGGFGGLYKLSRESSGDFYFKFQNKELGLPNLAVADITEDKEGRLILATSFGIYYQTINDKTFTFKKVIEGNFSSILIDNNNVWAGSDNGLKWMKVQPRKGFPVLHKSFKYDPTNPNSISKNIITSLYKDDTGIIWIGTNGGGLNKFDPARNEFLHIRKTPNPESLSYDKIRSFFEDSYGNLWVGTEGGGINFQSKEDHANEFFKFNSIPNVFAIEEIQVGSRKKLLLGGKNSISLYELDITNPKNIKSNKFKPIREVTGAVFSILSDSNNTLWFGTYANGVYRWTLNKDGTNYDKEVFTENPNDPRSLSNNIIRNIYEDSKGNIWFATGNGLSRLSKTEASKKYPKFDVYKNIPGDLSSLSHNYILPIFESTKGDLWIGTFGGGLNKFIPKTKAQPDHFKSYNDKDGLPNGVIKGILEDENSNLWISTNKGLSMFNPNTEIFKNYDVNNGLQSNEFQELACLKKSTGEMLFGGINGFNRFFPKELKENTYKPKTVFTNLFVLGKQVVPGQILNKKVLLSNTINNTKSIELNYFENNIALEFSALHYAAPNKNKFAYMLEGFDKDWIYTTAQNRLASYTNLEHGNYTFLVKSSNSDGLWDDTPSKIEINITPPFWHTTLAYLIYFIIFIILLISFRNYALITVTKKHQLELEHVEKEKGEELQQSKLEFFTNISHELRTPLTLIKGPLEYLQQSYDSLDRKMVFQQFSVMHKNTDLLLRLVNQLLGFRKIEKGKMDLVLFKKDIIGFIKELTEPFQFLSHKKEINFTIESSEDTLVTWFDLNAIEKIMNNLLSNAFKFTPNKGSITIKLFRQEIPEINEPYNNYITIQVDDSGPGISSDKANYIFERFYAEKESKQESTEGVGIGLYYTKKLVELHKGLIQASGSTFTVSIPIDEETYQNDTNVTLNYNETIYNSIFPSLSETYERDEHDESIDNVLLKTRSKLPILLVVDDNTDIRNFIAQMLNEDYTIYQAENGQEGLEMAKSVQPNIIISDVLMPVMNGFEFCENLKTKPETSHIPIIMLTAKSSDESELEGLKLGADSYIRKPFKIDFLKTKLTNIINERDNLRKRFNRKIVLKPKEVTVTSTDEKFLNQAIEIVEKHMSNTSFNVETLVQEMNFSRSNIYMKFKELTGLSSSEFIRNIRLKRAMQLLDTSGLTVKEIMYMTGFNTGSYFSKCFKNQYGVLPSEYLKKVKPHDKKNEINLDK
ncbi:two-component regulator propeller domain-containing protein [uncultured Algibacter sp.]|uniref:two-component regulator propeller domain-containing protein n=1 Tax=uncultured Algibacter sp. TaxID=298659 RepID=UPI002608BCA0|nr:two-component regulator propeller domain-containing protein [uncultured Algibacter sp.]